MVPAAFARTKSTSTCVDRKRPRRTFSAAVTVLGQWIAALCAQGAQNGKIWNVGFEERRVCDAPAEKGQSEERVGPEGSKPEAGDCHRPQRGAKKGSEGASQGIAQEKIAAANHLQVVLQMSP
jgi:hypothetical protein